MKIAYIGGRGLPSKSGMERVVEAITSRLADKHELTVYCDPAYTPANRSIDGIHLIRIPTIQGKYTGAASLYLFSALHALIKGDYDVIHVNGIETCFILPILRLRYPVVATAHGVPSRTRLKKWGKLAYFLMGLMEYPFLFLSNDPTCISSIDASYLTSRYKKNLIHIPNGVDVVTKIDQTTAINELGKLGLFPKNYMLFVAMRIDPLKGCHLILEALDFHPMNIPLVIVGDLLQVPEYGEKLKQMAANKQVYFLPPIEEKSLLFGIVKLCRFFIFPSFTEGMSMALLEAASLEAPVICSDIPENRVVLQQNGIYFRSGDSKDLADKMVWAMNHLQEIEKVACSASEMLIQNFSWDKIAREYEQQYLRYVSGRSSSIFESRQKRFRKD